MFEILPFMLCVWLRYHCHDGVPLWVWILSILTLLSSPTLKLTTKQEGG